MSITVYFFFIIAQVGLFKRYYENYTWGRNLYDQIAFFIRQAQIQGSFCLRSRYQTFFQIFLRQIDCRNWTLGLFQMIFFFFQSQLRCFCVYSCCFCSSYLWVLISCTYSAFLASQSKQSFLNAYFFLQAYFAAASSALLTCSFSSFLLLQSALSNYSYFQSFNLSSFLSSSSALFLALSILSYTLACISFQTLASSYSFYLQQLRFMAFCFFSLQILAQMQEVMSQRSLRLVFGNQIERRSKQSWTDLPLPRCWIIDRYRYRWYRCG